MATPFAIAAVSEGVRRLLDDACPRDRFAGAAVKVLTAAEMKKGDEVKTGLSVFLYRVAVNGPQRNRAARVTADGRRLKPSLPVDLYFLLTPWADSVVQQQQLLGWAMRTLEDAAILPAGLLNAASPEPDVFLPTEAVELTADPISLPDQSGLWQALQAPWQLSVGYIARMVALDSAVPIAAAGPVVERALDLLVRAEP